MAAAEILTLYYSAYIVELSILGFFLHGKKKCK